MSNEYDLVELRDTVALLKRDSVRAQQQIVTLQNEVMDWRHKLDLNYRALLGDITHVDERVTAVVWQLREHLAPETVVPVASEEVSL